MATVSVASVAAYAPWPGLIAATGERGHHDDRPAAHGLHVRDAAPRQLDRAEHVDLPRLLPLGEVGVHDRVVGRALCRTVDQHVDPAERLDGAVDERHALREVAHVGGHLERLDAEGPHLGGHLGEHLARRAASATRVAAPALPEAEGGGAADAGADAGYDRDSLGLHHGRAR